MNWFKNEESCLLNIARPGYIGGPFLAPCHLDFGTRVIRASPDPREHGWMDITLWKPPTYLGKAKFVLLFVYMILKICSKVAINVQFI